MKELNKAIRLIADVAERRTLTGEEATSLLRVVADYSFALRMRPSNHGMHPIGHTAASG
jgi:hypothetical protein